VYRNTGKGRRLSNARRRIKEKIRKHDLRQDSTKNKGKEEDKNRRLK
jgi:hypothetical protein